MKTYFGRLGIATLVFAWFLCSTPMISAQFLPPIMDEEQTEADPEMQHPDSDANPPLVANEPTAPDLPELTEKSAHDAVNGNASQQEQPKLVQTLNATETPQQVPGMNAYTILYFPPPTYPAPVPLTLYRPGGQTQMPMMPQGGAMPYGAMQPNGQVPIGLAGGAAQMYAPPMIIQKQHIGSATAYGDGGHHSKEGKRRLGRLIRGNKVPTAPGDPIIGPPVLVYPNGMIVKPKVYLPDQPFKNAVRAVTP